MAHLIVFDGERPAMPSNIAAENIIPYESSAYVVGGKITGNQILQAFEACTDDGNGHTALVVKIESYNGCARTSVVNRLSDVLRS